MAQITQILMRVKHGDPAAADQLLPLIYDELRKLAQAKMARESPGQTLQATALVHEAYLRLLGNDQKAWDSRGHFFSAAAEAMRRLLIEKARHKKSIRAGGQWKRIALEPSQVCNDVGILELNEAIDALDELDPRKASVVKLRCFVGFTISEVAEVLNISRATVENDWAYAKSWLKVEIQEGQTAD